MLKDGGRRKGGWGKRGLDSENSGSATMALRVGSVSVTLIITAWCLHHLFLT